MQNTDTEFAVIVGQTAKTVGAVMTATVIAMFFGAFTVGGLGTVFIVALLLLARWGRENAQCAQSASLSTILTCRNCQAHSPRVLQTAHRETFDSRGGAGPVKRSRETAGRVAFSP